ncbi:hypothetical protein A0H81_06138 [Grifola frondosa]|uniref:Uncharacterized protein n=1 Tax=Grifola frondosa TaxID=5627 RepID=A0A1C7MAE7_GRIFR|nr:hypothetical protein A0H81_06138 [Grifola frondosa]
MDEIDARATDEVRWVEDYGGWGTSEKGKWRAIWINEEDETHVNIDHSDGVPTAGRAETFYIYESPNAPEFLVGSSTSLLVRAVPGYSSRPPRPPVVRPRPRLVSRPRARRPPALVLANPSADLWLTGPLSESPPAAQRVWTQVPSNSPAYSSPLRASPRPAKRLGSAGTDASRPAGAFGRHSEQNITMPRMRGDPSDENVRQAASWVPSSTNANYEHVSGRRKSSLISVKHLFRKWTK